MASNATHFDFSGARILVTGGTSGIGAGIAAAYLAAGAEVTITGTRASARDYDTDLSDYRYLQLDVEDPAQVDAVAQAQTQLDVLVNNAGIALPSLGLDEWDPDNFGRAVNIHLVSGFRLARGCRDALRASELAGGASVIGIASMSSYFGMGIIPGYGAGKTGLLGVTRAMAVEWGPLGIRANCVAVGLCESRMTAATIANPEWSAPTMARTPLGRHGTPEDVAGAVLFLSSAQAGWITGQTLPIDGGYTVAG
ncbi:MAG: SDR family oxidoreductase [Haliea sp.]|uniref:SDR family NAD(P)-dependent oxidoreductase n=1 Tax=Haliea sp. TaxID=1932666 RepID=UPI0032EC4C85